MKIEQIYPLVNEITTTMLGTTGVLNEDLSNLVDVGTQIQNLQNWQNKFVSALVDRIGRTIFVNRPYSGSAPSVMMDSWEYGSILMKISSDLPEATVNESWELTDGASYDPFVYRANKAEAKFYNGLVTFELDKSIIDYQLKNSFSSPTELNSFISMIFNEVEKSMTVKNDGLIMRTINNAIAHTVFSAYGAGDPGASSSNRAVNLLYEYNQAQGLSGENALTAEKAIYTPEFIRFASYRMGLYVDRMARMSTLFNVGAKQRFTPRDMLHIVFLSEFEKAAGVYLYDAANQFNAENLRLPTAEVVPFWQGSGTTYGFSDTSRIDVTIQSGGAQEVQLTGILGVMFDRDALGVCNQNSRVTTQYNAKAEFTNYFYKRDARYFNDMNENFVVFYVADEG